jgi:hypothetical protein
MFGASSISVPPYANQMRPRSADTRRIRDDVATRDIRLAADTAPRGRHGDRDMSLALDQLEARIERIENEIVADVFHYLARNPGSRAGEIAAGLGVAQAVVSAHLYRGKGRMFASRAGRWYPVPEGDPG